MNINPWTGRKNLEISRVLMMVDACDIASDDGNSPRIVTLCYTQLSQLRVCI